jgi:hypothetical protein
MKLWENVNDPILENEIWKTIEDFPEYQVSNIGRVKSFKCHKEMILKQSKNSGYLFVNLCKNGKYKPKFVHRLVYETYKKKLEEGYDSHHINENKEDNYVENLESKPHKKHTEDHHKGKKRSEESKKKMSKPKSEETKKKMSENKKGENNPNFGKGISNQKIIDIQSDIEKGDSTQVEMAKKYGVCQATISAIKTGKSWLRVHVGVE